MCPIGKRLINGTGGWLASAEMCCHCLLIEGRQGLILVDTGLGVQDMTHPQRLGLGFNLLTRPQLNLADTALHQVKALGFQASDVRHIVVTHLDLDHAGGLGDFPDAQVHVSVREHDAAMQRATLPEKARYIPAQWAHQPKWVTHETIGETWKCFDAIHALPGTDDEVLLVPLPGHSRGHCGVAVKTDATDTSWLLHCGDAYFYRAETDSPPHCTLGLKIFQTMVQFNGPQRHANQQRLRELKRDHGQHVQLICAHDTQELAQHVAASHKHQ